MTPRDSKSSNAGVVPSAQVLSVSIAATFTVLEGQVSSLTWQFIEYAYAAVSTPMLLCTSRCACDHTSYGFDNMQPIP